MPEIISVKPAVLIADQNNPRVPDEGLNQREVLLAIAKACDGEIAALARDIVQYQSLDPSSLPIVIKADEPDRYRVLEGNRRLTALRAMENPALFEGAFSAPVLQEIRELSNAYRTAPIDKIDCCLMDTAAAAQHWIDLRHTGKNSGAGLVPWGPHEKARFNSRTKNKAETHTRLLDYLEDGGHLKKHERQAVPTAAFARLARTKSVRDKVGFSVDKNGELHFKNEGAAVNALLRITDDLVSQKIKTGNIYDLQQRNDYAATLPDATLKASAATVAAGATASAGKSVPKRQSPLPLLKAIRERDRLIPATYRISIADPRVRRIAKELQDLPLSEYPNGAAVLFRVFIELSADHYLIAKLRHTKDSLRDRSYTLRRKLSEVLQDMLSKKHIEKQDATPIRSALQKNSFLVLSVDTMNEYVHNLQMNPSPKDLVSTWDSFQVFITALWA